VFCFLGQLGCEPGEFFPLSDFQFGEDVKKNTAIRVPAVRVRLVRIGFNWSLESPGNDYECVLGRIVSLLMSTYASCKLYAVLCVGVALLWFCPALLRGGIGQW
jgi:hypothetical protein